MAWKTGQNSPLGMPNFQPTAIDAVAITTVGNIVTAFDDVLGYGEFIYLPGIANVVAGDVIAYALTPGSQAIFRANTSGVANTGRPLAVAISPVGAGQFGWFQISGIALVNALAGTLGNNPAFVSATAGSIQSTAIAGAMVIGARVETAVGVPSTGKTYVTLQRPCAQTQIT